MLCGFEGMVLYQGEHPSGTEQLRESCRARPAALWRIELHISGSAEYARVYESLCEPTLSGALSIAISHLCSPHFIGGTSCFRERYQAKHHFHHG